MYRFPPHHAPATVQQIAAIAMATVICLVLALTLPVEHGGGDAIPQPPHAPAGLDL